MVQYSNTIASLILRSKHQSSVPTVPAKHAELLDVNIPAGIAEFLNRRLSPFFGLQNTYSHSVSRWIDR